MDPVLALLRQGIAVIGNLDNLLLRMETRSSLLDSVGITMRSLQDFWWILNFRKSCSEHLEYLGLIIDSDQAKVFLLSDELLKLQSAVWQLLAYKQPSLCFCMRALGLMVAKFEAVLYSQFHMKPLQKEILFKWNRASTSLDNRNYLERPMRDGWMRSPTQRNGKSFLPTRLNSGRNG